MKKHTSEKRGARLGQHFLMHRAIAERIVLAAGVGAHDTVLEIGPGRGMLTRALLRTGARVIAVEADAKLVEELKKTFQDEIAKKRLLLVHADIRDFDPKSYKLSAESYKLVSNIPYYITGEIIRQFLSASHKPSSMTLLVQKEVAERIARNTKESLLSLSVKAYGTPKYAFTVPRGAFVPSPNVDSAVLSITDINPEAFATKKEETRFFSLIKAGFAHKRKRLATNLAGLVSKKRIETAFEALGLTKNTRAEEVSLPTWCKLNQLVHKQ